MTQQTLPQITTLDDFLSAISLALKADPDKIYRPLDEYLRALWGLVQAHQNDPVSFALLANLLTEATLSEATPFDQDWLQFTELPARNERDDDFEYLRKTILCQIADLHRIKSMNLSPQDLYGGVWLPTGNSWYNFQVDDFLWQALVGFRAHNGIFQKHLSTAIGRDPQSTQCDWFLLTDFLGLGQMYE
jgi:hypothetical protein